MDRKASLTRRTLLASTAAGTAALGLPRVAGAGAGPRVKRVDVVVVGGGLSGLSAARRLLNAGRSVVVLEANDRIGGRVLNLPTGPRPHQVTEAGGAWVAPFEKRIHQVLRELKIRTFPTFDTGKTIYLGGGEPQPFDPPVLPMDPAALNEVNVALGVLGEMAKTVPLDAPHKAAKADEWDSMTVESWLDDNVRLPEALALLRVAVGGPVGGTAASFSLLSYLFTAAANGSPLQLVTIKGGGLDSRIEGGSGLIVERLAAKVGAARIRRSSPVRRIEQSRRSVRVVSDHGTYEAGAVVVAVAPPMTTRIDFDPVLPAARAQFAAHTSMGWLIKCFAVYPTPFWRSAGLSGNVNSVVPPFDAVFDNSPRDGSVGCLFGLISGTEARIQSQRSAAARRRSVLETFVQCFGPKAAEPMRYFEHDWAAEPWIRGGAGMPLGPGVLTQFPGLIAKPVGRIHWASTETATLSSGAMEGAILAGERAAAEILR